MVICIFCLSELFFGQKWSKNAGKDLVEIFCCATDALNSDFVEGETTLLMLLLYYMVEFSWKKAKNQGRFQTILT